MTIKPPVTRNEQITTNNTTPSSADSEKLGRTNSSIQSRKPHYTSNWKWILLLFCGLIMFSNSIVTNSLKVTTEDFKKEPGLDIEEKTMQFLSVSCAYILAIPMSMGGSYVIQSIGVKKAIVAWSILGLCGWIAFCAGFQIGIDALILMFIGRMIQGGAFGAIRVTFNEFCVDWFRKKNVAASMGVIRFFHNLAQVLGSLMILKWFEGTLGWKLGQVYWRLCMFGGVSLLLSIFIAGIYCHVGAKFSTQPDHDSDDSNLNNNTIDRHVNIEIMNKASNTTNLNKLAESNPTSRESSIEICPPITLTQSAAVTKRKNLALNSASIDNIMKSLKEIFKNPIFFCIIVIGFTYDGCILCFNPILRRLLEEEFKRTRSESGFDMGIPKYFGLFAPFFGKLIDHVRHRELFMLVAGVCLVCGHGTLWLMPRTAVFRVGGMLSIGLGQVFYGNSFWPSIASIVGKEHRVVGYGLLGAITSFGAVVLPLIIGSVVDKQSSITYAELIFTAIASVGIVASLVMIGLNYYFIRELNINFLNRDATKADPIFKLQPNDQIMKIPVRSRTNSEIVTGSVQ